MVGAVALALETRDKFRVVRNQVSGLGSVKAELWVDRRTPIGQLSLVVEIGQFSMGCKLAVLGRFEPKACTVVANVAAECRLNSAQSAVQYPWWEH